MGRQEMNPQVLIWQKKSEKAEISFYSRQQQQEEEEEQQQQQQEEEEEETKEKERNMDQKYE